MEDAAAEALSSLGPSRYGRFIRWRRDNPKPIAIALEALRRGASKHSVHTLLGEFAGYDFSYVTFWKWTKEVEANGQSL